MIARRKNYDLRQKVCIKIVIMNNNSNIQKYEKTKQHRNYPEKNKTGKSEAPSNTLPKVNKAEILYNCHSGFSHNILFLLSFSLVLLEKEVEEKYSRRSQEMQAENCSGSTVIKLGSLSSVQSR